MGGNHSGVGNVTSCGEFNFWSDPEAAHIVLEESKCPIYICPWEVCLEASKATPLAEWRMEVSSNDNEVLRLMNPIGENVQIKGNFIPCDAYLTCCFIVPELIQKLEHCHVTVELTGTLTRGQMVVDHKKLKTPNAFVIKEIDAELFKTFLLSICGREKSKVDL